VRLASTAAVIRTDRWRARWITTEDVELSALRATIDLGVPQDLPRRCACYRDGCIRR
jgi:hypothetical protein